MSDNAFNDAGSNDSNKNKPRLTSVKLKTSDSLDLAPMTFDEFNAAFEPSTDASNPGGSAPTESGASISSASTGFGEFGAEIERQVKRASSFTPSTIGQSSDYDPFKPTPRSDGTDPFKSAPKPVEKPSKPAPLPSSQTSPKTSFKQSPGTQSAPSSKSGSTSAAQPVQRQKPAPSRTPPVSTTRPSHSGNTIPAGKTPEPSRTARFDTKTGKPLQQPPAPRFDTKTGKPLPQPPAPRFDTKTSNPFQQPPTGPSFSTPPKTTSEGNPFAPVKKKTPQIGCFMSIVIVLVLTWMFEATGSVVAVIAILLINKTLSVVFGESNSTGEDAGEGK